MADPQSDEVRRLRAEEHLSVREIRARTGLGRNRVYALLRGVPPPERSRRPNAKDDLRAEALALRSTGHSVPEIAQQLSVSRSTAYLWVRHLPLARDPEQERERRQAHSKAMTDAQWGEHRQAREAARAATVATAAAWVKELRYREVVLVGAALYWAEGLKTKPWRPHDRRVRFVNSDPALIELLLRFVEALGEHRAALRYRVSIQRDRRCRKGGQVVGGAGRGGAGSLPAHLVEATSTDNGAFEHG
ncbi:helix-turn-helix domain-containing protein [Micromonospora sp. NPDC047134]|uniref:helix-turn-helix domain-containing protein n=1 Tax=Micromonospora sp. NPDC047134 TaxID=3154340 RepID=UPI0033F49BD6